MATYVCYGLTLRSAIELPELGPELTDAPDSVVDVTISVGPLADPPEAAVRVDAGMWRHGDRYGLIIDGVGRFVAEHGDRIVVDPAPGSDDCDLRLFLLGTMIGAIMMQRGHLVLHACGVRLEDACLAVVGHSGAGKSTLAAEFARRGFDVLSDDVVPIDEQCRALTGYPRVKLWDDALTRLGVPADGLEPVRREVPKFSLPVVRQRADALPLRWIYALETHDGNELELADVTGLAKFELLGEHTYRSQFLYDHDSSWTHAQQCAALGRRARVARVRRPARTMDPQSTADAILADIDARRVP